MQGTRNWIDATDLQAIQSHWLTRWRTYGAVSHSPSCYVASMLARNLRIEPAPSSICVNAPVRGSTSLSKATACSGLLVGLAVAAQLAACYPHPHLYISRQEFTGVWLRGGAPVSGATVLVGHSATDGSAHCTDASDVTTTNNAGVFHVDSIVEKKAFRSLLNPPDSGMQITTICFRVGREQKLGATTIARTNREMPYSLSCDWLSPPIEFKQQVILSDDQWGICKSV